MKLVGIDFAANPRNCGVCVLEDEVITHIGHGIAHAKHPECPAASLWAWGLRHRNLEMLVTLEHLRRAFRLSIPEQVRQTILESRHCFDALVAALTAREYANGNTFDPPERFSDETLKVEGWIRIPNRTVE